MDQSRGKLNRGIRSPPPPPPPSAYRSFPRPPRLTTRALPSLAVRAYLSIVDIPSEIRGGLAPAGCAVQAQRIVDTVFPLQPLYRRHLGGQFYGDKKFRVYLNA